MPENPSSLDSIQIKATVPIKLQIPFSQFLLQFRYQTNEFGLFMIFCFLFRQSEARMEPFHFISWFSVQSMAFTKIGMPTETAWLTSLCNISSLNKKVATGDINLTSYFRTGGYFFLPGNQFPCLYFDNIKCLYVVSIVLSIWSLEDSFCTKEHLNRIPCSGICRLLDDKSPLY